jgi:glucose/arabinose dehydrogenase
MRWARIGVFVALLATPVAAQDTPLKLPPGFRIESFARDLAGARFMTLDPAGTILLSAPRQNRVVALPDGNRDGRADRVVTVAEGLNRPHGLAFKDGAFYVAETGRILRFRYDPATHKASEPSVVVPSLPVGAGHWTRTIAFAPDGRLFVSVGSSCNICKESDPRRAAIVRYEADGSGERLFATGLRNAVGIAFHPGSSVLWATVNERDWKGDDLPPEYVTDVKEGGFYGWPECFVAGRQVVRDDRAAPADRCEKVTLPTLEVQAHSAPLGLAFYTGEQFPPEYRGSLFIAYHGSWNRTVPTGYKVVRVPFANGRPSGAVEDFATGWLGPEWKVFGRPVDVLTGPDGALYLSDDNAGVVYRITYRP